LKVENDVCCEPHAVHSAPTCMYCHDTQVLSQKTPFCY
jgi:hypothetical protein